MNSPPPEASGCSPGRPPAPPSRSTARTAHGAPERTSGATGSECSFMAAGSRVRGVGGWGGVGEKNTRQNVKEGPQRKLKRLVIVFQKN